MIVARKSCPHPTAARAINKVTPDANFIILIPKSPLQFWKTEMIIHKVPPGSYTRWYPVGAAPHPAAPHSLQQRFDLLQEVLCGIRLLQESGKPLAGETQQRIVLIVTAGHQNLDSRIDGDDLFCR